MSKVYNGSTYLPLLFGMILVGLLGLGLHLTGSKFQEKLTTQSSPTNVEPASQLDPKCLLQPDPGTCFAHVPSYYFDQDEFNCKEFIWGGCGGVRPFNTLSECQSACLGIRKEKAIPENPNRNLY